VTKAYARELAEQHTARVALPATPNELLTVISSRMSFGYAPVADAVQRWAPATLQFVSWDAKHFRARIPAPALTPREFLRA
jgi:hypothetical protein